MNPLLYLFNILLIAGLAWWLHKQVWAAKLQPYFYPALLVKLLCGILVGLLYFEYYREGDTISYQNASEKLTALARVNFSDYLRLLFFNEFPSEEFRSSVPFSRLPDFSNSFFMLKIVSTLNLLTKDSYYLNSLYLSLFSFWGVAKLAASLSTYFPASRNAAVIAFLFFPSVVFWSSGLLKDSVMMGSMCWVVAFVLQLAYRKRAGTIEAVIFLLMLYLYIRMKIFFAAPLLILLAVYLFVSVLRDRYKLMQDLRVQLVLTFIFSAVAGGLATQVIQIYRIEFVMDQIVTNYHALRLQSLHVPHIEFTSLQPGLFSLLLHAPQAFLSAVYRPFLGESTKLFFLIAGIENLLLLLLSFLAVASFFKERKKGIRLFYMVLLLYILVTGVLMGLTTPNFGTLSRYRVAFLPFLVYLLLQSHYAQRLLKKLGLSR